MRSGGADGFFVTAPKPWEVKESFAMERRAGTILALSLAVTALSGCGLVKSVPHGASPETPPAQAPAKNPYTPGTWEFENHAGVEALSSSNWDEAESHLLKALNIAESSNDNGTVAATLLNLSSAYEGREMYAESLPLLNRAVKLFARTYGTDHRGVAVTLNRIGNVLNKEERYGEAVPIFRRCIKVEEAPKQVDYDALIETLHNYQIALRKTGGAMEANQIDEQIKQFQAKSKK
jgi:tetratricopeptide (TPR) repeat protein